MRTLTIISCILSGLLLAPVGRALASCGDGTLEGPIETCDDGNTTSGDGCDAACLKEIGWDCPNAGDPCVPICGDALVVGPEVCDDGNTAPDDCCSPDCLEVTDAPPVCTAAAASIDSLWPPNHKSVPIGITGVTDPDGDPVAIEVTAIAQDEPVDDTGDGATCPDAGGVGTDSATVRSERSGQGDGRVYHIAFKATDTCGLSCESSVEVCVRHDNGHGGGCGDGGPLYDSTAGESGCDGSSCEPVDCITDPEEIAPCGAGVPEAVDERLARARKLLDRAGRKRGGKGRHLGAKAARQLTKAAHHVERAASRGKVSQECASALGAALDDAASCARCSE